MSLYDEMEESLSPEDIFDEEIDQGEMAEIAESLVLPEGKYYPEVPFEFKVQKFEGMDVVSRDGEPRTITRRVVNFWGDAANEEGQVFKMGLKITPDPLYALGTGDARVFYQSPVPGAKPDLPTKHFNQANKLYKKAHGEFPKKFGELVEFLRSTPLRLTNVVRDGDDGKMNFTAGFNLASE